MTTHQNTSKQHRPLQGLALAALVAGALALPASAQATPLALVKSRVDQTHNQVKKIKNDVADIVADLEEKRAELRKAGIKELKDTIISILTYMRQAQAGYQDFVAPDNCGRNSECSAFRDKLHDAVLDFAELPASLPFVEQVPPAVEQLYESADLVDYIPPPVLYVSARSIESTLDEAMVLLEMLRSAAAKMPPLPTKSELMAAVADSASAQYRSYCSLNSDPDDNPHVKLVLTLLDAIGSTLGDLADMVQEEISAAIVGEGTGVKNPLQLAVQMMAFVPNSAKRGLETQIALQASVCAIR